ncbi:Immunogenic protein MPT70 [Myxococcaceae bacterium]|jgi:uncharacterized surface protein with fasciclin (FAS1) repeats|nr:Immunogenic protein MPT70 [Myxococcaceae bacterium]
MDRFVRSLAIAALALGLAAPASAADTRAMTVTDVASASKDHTTLVKALEAADYAVALRNPGPFTVFAPTNAAFEKLPPGTLDTLMKPENKGKLEKILQHHVLLSTYEKGWFKDGQSVSMVDGTKATMHVADGKVKIDGAEVVASVRCGNGIVHVVDAVVLPPEAN